MTPQELRYSILQEALQGKLVEQRHEEGMGAQVYAHNQQVRKLYQAEYGLKQNKCLATIEEEELLFDIPESWTWVRLGDYCIDFFSGKSPVYSKVPTKYRVIGQAANQQNGIDFEQVKYTTESFWDNMPHRFFLQENDVLLNTLGNGTLGRSGVVPKLDNPLLTDGHLFVFRLNDYYQAQYFYYFLQYQRSEIEKDASGSTNQTFLSLTKTMNWVVPIPPYEEQKRIVLKIQALLPYIERYDEQWKKINLLDKQFPLDMRKSVLHTALEGKLIEPCSEDGTGEDLLQKLQKHKENLVKEKIIKREKQLPVVSDDEKPFDIPENWTWARLGDVCWFQGGYAYKSTSYVPNSNNQLIRLGNVKQNHLLLDAKPAYIPDSIAVETEAYRIKKDDLLLTMTGTRRKKDYLFVSRIQDADLSEKKLYLNQRVGCLRVFDGVDPAYLQRVLQDEVIRDIIFEKETGTANQGNLGSEDMKMYIYVPLPPLEEQKRIVAKLDELLPLCDRLK